LGTKEWADSNVNIFNGCSNNCRYCYAKMMAIRFKRKTNETWKIMEPNREKIEKGYRKRKGRVMFPSSHDITKEILDDCIFVLRKLLNAENEVLITSKPRFLCIKRICEKFQDKKHLIQFRFTITSSNEKKLKFWEPGAPSFKERFKSLKYAFNKKFRTSISIEPFLDKNPYRLVDLLLPYSKESIWIGKMNYIKETGIKPENKSFYEEIRAINSDKNLLKIIKMSQKYKKNMLRIKDSIYNYLSK